MKPQHPKHLPPLWDRLGGCHTRYLLQSAGSAREFLRLEHRPEAIDAWVCTLRTRFNGQPLAICLERTKGPMVSAPRTYDCSCSFPSIRSPWPRTAKRFPRAGPQMTPPMPHARSSSCSHTATNSPPLSTAKPHYARLGATRRTPPAPRRRHRPAHASLDEGAQKLLPPCPTMVSGKRYGALLRRPEPLADPESRSTRASHHPGAFFPCPPRALGRRHHHPH